MVKTKVTNRKKNLIWYEKEERRRIEEEEKEGKQEKKKGDYLDEVDCFGEERSRCQPTSINN